MRYPATRFALLWLTSLATLLPAALLAQLSVSFSSDKPGDCAPAQITFTHSITGASPNARLLWDLGNGNTSTLASPSATYLQPGQYTVRLTVTDGALQASSTETVTVYNNPTVDFKVLERKVCIPDAATFIAEVNPGSGQVQTLTWAFGDGTTRTEWGNLEVSHNYTQPQVATVALSVANSFGCHTAVVKRDIVEILPPILIEAAPDKDFVCARGDRVNFTNTSTGPGTLTYRWTFGDGTTSTQRTPQKVYNQSGTYEARLRVTSSEGCSKQSDPMTIHVDNFVTSFSEPTLLCEQDFLTLENTSKPQPTETIWTIGNDDPVSLPGNFPIGYFMNERGPLKVTMQNTFGTCVQNMTRTITVQPRPQLTGFIAELAGKCGAPDTIRLRDTTATANRWQWRTDFSSTPFSTQQQAAFVATFNSSFIISLVVTNPQGCTQNASTVVSVRAPQANIFLRSSTSTAGQQSCGPFTAVFAAQANDSIVAYNWSFSNGGSSTLREPEHSFTTTGNHTITLNYRLANGCTGVATYTVSVFGKPVANFEALNTSRTLCGPTPGSLRFTGTGATTGLFWNFDYDNNPQGYTSASSWSYNKDTTYTVALIAINGPCRDTIVKKNFFTVLPPFPRITRADNTCDGTRGRVTFAHETRKGITGTWTFGDGTTAPFDPNEPTIAHTYTQSGTYTVSLRVTNGACEMLAGITAQVLLKQNPQFALGAQEVCGRENFNFSVTGLESNPRGATFNHHYFFTKWEEGRSGTLFDGSYNVPWNTRWLTNVEGTANSNSFAPREIRAIIQSSGFGCLDTTNFVNLRFRGAQAGFQIVQDSLCFQQQVVFRDTSRATGSSSIVSRRWLFGDGTSRTTSEGGLVNHRYTRPGRYWVELEVTDAAGCRVQTRSARFVDVSGPQVAFSMGPDAVPLNETVFFNNQTNPGSIGTTRYLWDFGDGNTSTDFFAQHTFPRAGTYRIQLIGINELTGCRDTATRTLLVRPFNTAFQIGTSFVHSSNCPPVLVQFNNTSFGGVSYEWDFGDGTGSASFSPAHMYTRPGVYPIALRVFGFNGLEGTFRDTVTIGLPEATFAATPLFGCTEQQIGFRAQSKNVTDYLWDFGDGTLRQNQDANTTHGYLSPGRYQPRLLVSDSNGCMQALALPDTIVIDSLSVSLAQVPKSLCDTATLLLQPQIQSVSTGGGTAGFTYSWQIEYGTATTPLNGREVRYAFDRPGRYILRFRVQTPFGCDKTTTDTLVVVAGARALITGPDSTCVNTPITLGGNTTQGTAGVTWRWLIGTNQTFAVQNPPVQNFAQPGTVPVQLITTFNQCADTARKLLTIHPNPQVQLANRSVVSCLGRGVSLQASGAATWQWSPAAGLSNINTASPLANPNQNTTYTVTGTSLQGCVASDTVRVRVVQPVQVNLSPANADICAGGQVTLNATGAAQWQWIQNTSGLSTTNQPNVVATPAATTTYTLVGRDADGCFADTAQATIVVHPLPTVNAGPDQEIVSGNSLQLEAATTGTIARYAWTPPTDLSCTACPNPVATPRIATAYVVTVTTDKGCTAMDTVRITLSCGDAYYIPTAFTPNGDGLNDYFYVLGGGGTVKLIRLYSRWGQLIFERSNVQVNDRTAGWDGTLNGKPAPTASYIYTAVIECADGTVYEYKGSVLLLR